MAARLNTVLVEDEESLVITSGALGGERLRNISRCVENVVLFKAYRNTKDINDAMEETGFLESSMAISRCGRDKEQIISNVRELEMMPPDYWALVIAKKNGNGQSPIHFQLLGAEKSYFVVLFPLGAQGRVLLRLYFACHLATNHAHEKKN